MLNSLQTKYHGKHKCLNIHAEINRKGYYEQEAALLFGNLYGNKKVASKNFTSWFKTKK
jgi:hypothetical protein